MSGVASSLKIQWIKHGVHLALTWRRRCSNRTRLLFREWKIFALWQVRLSGCRISVPSTLHGKYFWQAVVVRPFVSTCSGSEIVLTNKFWGWQKRMHARRTHAPNYCLRGSFCVINKHLMGSQSLFVEVQNYSTSLSLSHFFSLQWKKWKKSFCFQ